MATFQSVFVFSFDSFSGEMELTMSGVTYHLKPGDRCDVPANTVHSAKMGPHGCTYLIGEPN
jgi:quercetin dioxygenase-like cupin family protein